MRRFVCLAAVLAAPAAVRAAETTGGEKSKPVAAAPAETPPDPGARMLEMFERELKLTPEQKEKTKAILDQGRSRRQELQKKMMELGEQLRKLQRQDGERIRAFLNDDQKDRFDEIKVRMRKMEALSEEMRHGGPRRGQEEERRWPRSPEPPPGFDRERRMPGDESRDFPPEFLDEIPGKGKTQGGEAPKAPEGGRP